MDFRSLWEYDDAPQSADHVEIKEANMVFLLAASLLNLQKDDISRQSTHQMKKYFQK
ncbi:MAG: hypothetical protein U5J95_03310 [Balneolaceae bacterium]|nr:hypothetical protein [Balneolaceae bacterium]